HIHVVVAGGVHAPARAVGIHADRTGAVDDGVTGSGVGGDAGALAVAGVHVDAAVAVHVGIAGGVREDAGGVAVVGTGVDGGAGVVDADIAGVGMRVDAGRVVERRGGVDVAAPADRHRTGAGGRRIAA